MTLPREVLYDDEPRLRAEVGRAVAQAIAAASKLEGGYDRSSIGVYVRDDEGALDESGKPVQVVLTAEVIGTPRSVCPRCGTAGHDETQA